MALSVVPARFHVLACMALVHQPSHRAQLPARMRQPQGLVQMVAALYACTQAMLVSSVVHVISLQLSLRAAGATPLPKETAAFPLAPPMRPAGRRWHPATAHCSI